MSDEPRLPTWGQEQEKARRMQADAELELLQSLSRDAHRKRIEGMAADLYRDRYRLAGIIAMLQREGIHDDLVIVAPARGGKLQGGSFLGLPIVEADVARCLVAVGAPPEAPVVADTTAEPRCSTCGEPMSSPGCSLAPGDRRPRAEAGFHTIDGPGPIEAGD